MVTYDEAANISLIPKGWQFGGASIVTSQHNVQCCECSETKLCWAILIRDQMSYFCEECRKKLFEKDTATVSVEKANDKSKQMINHRFIKPEYMNSVGTLFGGQLLSWFDEETALYAYECLSDDHPKRMTSVCVYAFNFLKPAFVAERIRSRWQLVHVGNTSLTVKGMYDRWETTQHTGSNNEWVLFAQGYSCLCVLDGTKPTKVHLKSEIDVKKIRANKEWEIVENFKSLTRLDK